MASFGKNQLLKYGWESGKGLGIDGNGMINALKPKLKFDSAGFGHDMAEEFTFHWWDHNFNKTAQNLLVQKNEDGQVQINQQKDFHISTKKPKNFKVKKTKNGNGLYDYFVKGSILNGSSETFLIDNQVESDSDSEVDSRDYSSRLTDEQLFQICGGQTAHKGARHGLTMSAKLDRLERQDKSLLELSSRSPSVLDNLKPILRESTPKPFNFKKRKSVQFNEDIKLKIFSYSSRDKEADRSLKMENGRSPSSAVANYVEEYSTENNIVLCDSFMKIKKKKKKKRSDCDENDDDVWCQLFDSLHEIKPDKASMQLQREVEEGGELENENDERITINLETFETSHEKTTKKSKKNKNLSQIEKKDSKNILIDLNVVTKSNLESITNVSNSEKIKKRKKHKSINNEIETEVDYCTAKVTDDNTEPIKKKKSSKHSKVSEILLCDSTNMKENKKIRLEEADDAINGLETFPSKKKKKKKKHKTKDVPGPDIPEKEKGKRKLETESCSEESSLNMQCNSPKKKKKKLLIY